jgi:hypothetical protein
VRTRITYDTKADGTTQQWTAHISSAFQELSPDNSNYIQPTVAANAFVQVIMMLRNTFVQDSALMMELRLPYHLATFNLL